MGRTSSPTFLTRFAGVAIATAATTLFMIPNQASAETRLTAISESVSHADLDLSSAKDARVLLRRIHGAAIRACGSGPVHTPLNPRASADFRDCWIGAERAAVASLNAPMLTALHEKKTLKSGGTV